MNNSRTPPRNSIASNMAYHDYLAMLCFVDNASKATSLQEKNEGCWMRAHHDFAKRCGRYRDDVDENYDEFCKANTGNEAQKDKLIESHLFNPLCYQAIDRPCNLDIVLLDDFDAAHHLASMAEINVEDTYLAFCPMLKSMQIENPWNVLCEFNDLFGKNPQRLERQEEEVGKEYYEPILHEFQKDLPLLAFTRYKMDGLGAIGQSMLFQQSLFRAMANKINAVIELLRGKYHATNSEADLIAKDDLMLVKCVFLDLQGAEEVGTLIACNNYSVAMSLVAGLRSLTFGDLFSTSNGYLLKQLLNDSEAHKLIFQLGRDKCAQEQLEDTRDSLKNSHALRWTHTSFAITSGKLSDGDYSNCNGYIEALGQFKLSPGHRLIVEKEIESIFKHHDMKMMPNNNLDYCRYQIGRGDFIVPYGPFEEQKKLFPVMKTQSFIEVFTNALKKFRFCGTKQWRDVVDIAAYLTVPVPLAVLEEPICEKAGLYHVHPLTKVLCQIQNRLCYFNDKKDELELIETGPRQGLLDIGKLKEIPRLYGVPVSLRRRVEYLYQSFAILIGDPYMFDLVLDLYDTFLTLHAILTKHLKAVREAEVEKSKGPKLHYLDEDRVAQLSAIVDAIHNAMMHRITKSSFQEGYYREMEIDFRGGLNQMLLAADSPVKCGLGLVRKFNSNSDRDKRERMGGLTFISSMPGAKINNLNFGTEAEAHLAYFEADVPHVLHPPSSCDNLHESFHLIFDILWNEGKFRNAIQQLTSLIDRHLLKEELPVMRKRSSEVFAHLMTHIFVFGPDKANFLRHHLLSYSKSIQSVGRDDCGTMVQFSELMIRLFLVSDAIPDDLSFPYKWEEKWIREEVKIVDIIAHFKNMVEDYGPFFSDYKRLWIGINKEDMQEYCWRQFNDIYPKMAKFMPYIWSEAIKVYKHFMKDAFGEDSSQYISHYLNVENDIKKLSEGHPMIRSLYNNNKLDPLFLICRILHHYLKKLDYAKGREIHLCRLPESRKVTYPKRDQDWYEFQTDRGGAALFCPVPTARRSRLRIQIAVLKTFWDISSNLRRRRLRDIILDNWPELSKKELLQI